MKSLIVIPVYNEEHHVRKVIETVQHYSGEDILAIDDGSEDRSGEILKGIRGIRVLEQATNQGYGAVLMRGFSYAVEMGYEVVLTMDCDEQHEPHLIPEFLKKIQDVDIVSGSRYLYPVPKELPPPEARKRINREITRMINRHTSLQLTDAFCGFKAYKLKGLKRLSLNEKGYGFPLQLWIQAHAAGLTVLELSVGLIYKNYQRSFGLKLDNPENRLQYYKNIILREIEKIETPIRV